MNNVCTISVIHLVIFLIQIYCEEPKMCEHKISPFLVNSPVIDLQFYNVLRHNAEMLPVRFSAPSVFPLMVKLTILMAF